MTNKTEFNLNEHRKCINKTTQEKIKQVKIALINKDNKRTMTNLKSCDNS